MKNHKDLVTLIERDLKLRLKKSRYEHTLRVRDTAILISKKYICNKEQIEIAALLHDFAKNMTNEELRSYIDDNNLDIDDLMKRNVSLSHGLVSAHMAKNKYGISSKEILDAITFHTIGNENMGIVSKIIYIADYIEPKRDFRGLNKIRKLAFENIDLALLISANTSIEYLMDKNLEIHMNSIYMRNFLVRKIFKNKKMEE